MHVTNDIVFLTIRKKTSHVLQSMECINKPFWFKIQWGDALHVANKILSAQNVLGGLGLCQ
jgi:hypothetical protein